MPGFTDLIGTGNFQRANQSTLTRQFGNNLAVRPGVDTNALAQGAQQRFRQGAAVDLLGRRLDIEENALDFERSQLPFTIGIGAANLGLGVLGVVRDNQQRQENREFTREERVKSQAAFDRRSAFANNIIASMQARIDRLTQSAQPTALQFGDSLFPQRDF